MFDGYSDERKKILRVFTLDVGEIPLLVVWKTIGINYILQTSLLKQEIGLDEIYEDTWGARENNGYLMLKLTYYQMQSVTLDIKMEGRNQLFLVLKTIKLYRR